MKPWLIEWQKKNGVPNKKIKEEYLENIKKLYYDDQLSVQDIAEIYDVTLGPMQRFMKKNGFVFRTKSEAKLVSSKTNIGLNKWRKKHGSWCKGLNKNDPKMKALIEKGKVTQIKNGKNKGEKNPMHGKVVSCRSGYRKDLGHYVRSSWEANFARILQYLGLQYQYEPKTFLLKTGETYTPDFLVRDKFYEIKGYERNSKHIDFQIDYPHIKLVVIREKFYNRLITRFAAKIAFIESEEYAAYTNKEIEDKFIQYLATIDSRASVQKFCKSLGISPKIIRNIYGSEKVFINQNLKHIKQADINHLLHKYNELTNPTRRDFYQHYKRAARLVRKYFGSYGQFCTDSIHSINGLALCCDLVQLA